MYATVIPNRNMPARMEFLTYGVPADMKVQIGQAVRVPFRNKHIYGIVWELSKKKPLYKTRDIKETIGTEPSLLTYQIDLIREMSDFYCLTPAKIAPLFLPRELWKKPFSAGGQGAKKSGAKSLITGPVEFRYEQYREAIEKALKDKKQILVLVPETASVGQIAEKLNFQDAAIFAEEEMEKPIKEKHAFYENVRMGKIDIVIGTRHNLFLPFKNLGLIVIESEDSEHYKAERTPRYIAKTVALKLSKLTGADILLGSPAAPLESLYAARIENWNMQAEPPFTQAPEIIDMTQEKHHGNFSPISFQATEAINKNLAEGKSVLVFLNRLGMASALYCLDCNKLPKCAECKTVLTVHRNAHGDHLMCHQCGFVLESVMKCPSCGGARLKQLGIGTDGAEQELRARFARALIHRLDSTASKIDRAITLNAHPNDIVIATQMITNKTNLHRQFGLIVILEIDSLLHKPHFRASEQTLQLMAHLSAFGEKNAGMTDAGMNGAKMKSARMLIQTRTPDHEIFAAAVGRAAVGTAATVGRTLSAWQVRELQNRKLLSYPPFADAARISSESAAAITAVKQEILLINPKLIAREHRVLHKGKKLYTLQIRGKNLDETLRKIKLSETASLDREPL